MMRRLVFVFLLGVVFAPIGGVLYAVPAAPGAVELRQPDGTAVKVLFKGDEFYKWNEDAAGYTVLYDTATKTWFYGEPEPSGSLVLSAYQVGKADPGRLGLKKHTADRSKIKRAQAMRAARSPRFHPTSASTAGAGKAPVVSGTRKNLVIMASFPDLASSFTQTQFNDLFNKAGYSYDSAAGSLKDYYHEVSYNKLTIDSVVAQWVLLPHPYAYYGANDSSGNDVRPQEMVLDAINALDGTGFNFGLADGDGDGEVDQLTVIHSGRGEEANAGINPDYIWSHQWNLTAPVYKSGKKMFVYTTEPEMRGTDGVPSSYGIMRIGVLAHETGHYLGLPDLYDTTYASAGAGDFCLMAYGSWGGVDGRSPAHLSAYCRLKLGWASAVQLAGTGNYSLPAIESSDTALYKFSGEAFPAGEYFLAENRQKLGFDTGLPGLGGILIWHVDESVPDNANAAHYLADLEEAGGIQHLELNTSYGDDEDYFRAGNSPGFGEATNPNSKSYQGRQLGLLLKNFSPNLATMNFDVAAPVSSQGGLPKLVAYPNPCYFNRDLLTIGDVPSDTRGGKAYIYDVAGHLVTTLGQQPATLFIWNGRDKWGQKASSGLYLYVVKTDNYGDATGKFYIFW